MKEKEQLLPSDQKLKLINKQKEESKDLDEK